MVIQQTRLSFLCPLASDDPVPHEICLNMQSQYRLDKNVAVQSTAKGAIEFSRLFSTIPILYKRGLILECTLQDDKVGRGSCLDL